MAWSKKKQFLFAAFLAADGCLAEADNLRIMGCKDTYFRAKLLLETTGCVTEDENSMNIAIESAFDSKMKICTRQSNKSRRLDTQKAVEEACEEDVPTVPGRPSACALICEPSACCFSMGECSNGVEAGSAACSTVYADCESKVFHRKHTLYSPRGSSRNRQLKDSVEYLAHEMIVKTSLCSADVNQERSLKSGFEVNMQKAFGEYCMLPDQNILISVDLQEIDGSDLEC